MGGEVWSASKMDLAKHIFFSVLSPSIRKGVEWLPMVRVLGCRRSEERQCGRLPCTNSPRQSG